MWSAGFFFFFFVIAPAKKKNVFFRWVQKSAMQKKKKQKQNCCLLNFLYKDILFQFNYYTLDSQQKKKKLLHFRVLVLTHLLKKTAMVGIFYKTVFVSF